MEYKLPELVGADQEYVYTISRTDQTEYADMDTLMHAYKGELYMEYIQAAYDGVIDQDKDEYDFIVRRLAEQYGFKYERKKR
jgi:hypothetical protein